MKRVWETRTSAMSGTEKFMFLGAVTLAALVIRQAPEATLAPGPQDTDALAVSLEAPATVLPIADTLPVTPPAPVAATILSVKPATFGFLASLSACPGLSTSHAFDVGADLLVQDYKPFVLVNNKVRLATAPVGGGCWSSAFGMRNGRLHKGVDYYSKTAVPIYAAGSGTIRKREYRSDYGNMIVIDHGDGVYTRYAHLQSFAELKTGDKVNAGEEIGIMGNTAGYRVPRHLHFEVLTGIWKAGAGSFALTPVDVMTFPAAE